MEGTALASAAKGKERKSGHSRPQRRKILITSALPYANGELHIGHPASTYLPADVFTRFCRLKGYDVVHICATDDFGTPILIKAEEEGKTPEEYVAYWNRRDRDDFGDLGVSFDFFYKTSSTENVRLAQYFFKKLHEGGYIYPKEITQPFCETDKKFLPDRYVIGTCPFCGSPNQYSDGCEACGRAFEPWEVGNPRCAICGNRPVPKQSKHYFFRLSDFSEKLRQLLTSNQNLQPEVKNYVLNWIIDGLKDWDITRDIAWGVPIPLAEARGKVLYGWFDNHVGYISSALHYFKRLGKDGKRFWNSSTVYHFIGKDIVYHHYLFLQAMRLGLKEEFKLPDFIPTRGHLLLQGQKISKSRGWYISLKDFVQSFPVDYLRYYLSAITPYSQSDVNFDWDEFEARINNELVANIGNFIYRVLSFVDTRFGGKVPSPDVHEELDEEFEKKLSALPQGVGADLERNHIDKALRKIIEFCAYCNRYFQRKEPWSLRKGTRTCLHLTANTVKCLAILLAPYIPHSSESLWKQLNLGGSVHKQGWDTAGELTLKPGHEVNKPLPLFRKIAREEVVGQKQRLEKAILAR